MWAMMPMFLNLLKSCLAIAVFDRSYRDLLPLIVREGFIRVRHAVRIFLLLHCVTAVVCRVENLCRETISHRLFTTAAGIGDDPANCQGTASFLVYFDRHLIRRTADASRLYFDRGLHVVNRPLENFQRLFA